MFLRVHDPEEAQTSTGLCSSWVNDLRKKQTKSAGHNIYRSLNYLAANVRSDLNRRRRKARKIVRCHVVSTWLFRGSTLL